MTDDDRPDADEATPEAAAKAADRAYQEGFDDAATGLEAVRTALAVLAAEIDVDGLDPMSRDALREARVESCRAIARVMRGVAPDPIED